MGLSKNGTPGPRGIPCQTVYARTEGGGVTELGGVRRKWITRRLLSLGVLMAKPAQGGCRIVRKETSWTVLSVYGCESCAWSLLTFSFHLGRSSHVPLSCRSYKSSFFSLQIRSRTLRVFRSRPEASTPRKSLTPPPLYSSSSDHARIGERGGEACSFDIITTVCCITHNVITAVDDAFVFPRPNFSKGWLGREGSGSQSK